MDDKRPEWLANQHRHMMELYDRVNEIDGSVDTDAACAILVGLSELKSAMGMIYDDMVNKVTEMLQEETIVNLGDGYIVEKKWSKARKGWQHKDLASVVASRIEQMSIDLDTGEVMLTPRQMAEKMLEFMQPSYWRVGPLESIGLNADDYCEAGDSTPSIRITKPKTN